MPERLQLHLARQRLETAAKSYCDALKTRHGGTIAMSMYELGAAAVALGNIGAEERAVHG